MKTYAAGKFTSGKTKRRQDQMTIRNTNQSVDKKKYDDNFDGINWKSKKEPEAEPEPVCPVCFYVLEDGKCTGCGWKK